MESSRTLASTKKGRLVLNKKFAITKELQVEDTGQLLITGFIESEKLNEFVDGEEILTKNIYITEAEIVRNKTMRDL